jgi:hypothetical protein
LAGATVNVGGAYVATTNGNGGYTIPGIYVGTYTASASKLNYTAQAVNVSIAANTTTVANFTLETPPPGPVTDFTAAGGNTANTLTWTNPTSANFAGAVIRGKTSGSPAGPSDGVLVANRPAAPGTSDSFTHEGLMNGTTWYYAAFAYAGDAGRYYAAGATAAATPAGPGDLDRDGDVDQDDFGWLQRCLSGSYTAQPDPACRDARLDGDEDVDDADIRLFLLCVSRPNVPSDPECLP